MPRKRCIVKFPLSGVSSARCIELSREKALHLKVYRIFSSRTLTPPFNTHLRKNREPAPVLAILNVDTYRRCYRFKPRTRRNNFEEIVSTSRASLLKKLSSHKGGRRARKEERSSGGEKPVKGKRVRRAVLRALDGKDLNHRGAR